MLANGGEKIDSSAGRINFIQYTVVTATTGLNKKNKKPSQLLHPVTTFKCGVYYKHLKRSTKIGDCEGPIWTPLIILKTLAVFYYYYILAQSYSL